MNDDNFRSLDVPPTLPPQKPKSFRKRALIGLGGVAALCLTKLVLSYFVTETEVHMSKYDGWDQEFKTSFVGSCAEASKKSLIEHLSTIAKGDKGEYDKIGTTYSKTYCSCIANKIEKKNLIATKYNKLSGAAKYEKEITKAIESYMAGPEGVNDAAECTKMAETESGVRITPEEYFTSTCSRSTVSALVAQTKLAPEKITPDQKSSFESYAKEYCGCVSSGVFKAIEVAIPKDERRPTSDDVTNDFIDQYIQGTDGKILIQNCVSLAQSEINK